MSTLAKIFAVIMLVFAAVLAAGLTVYMRNATKWMERAVAAEKKVDDVTKVKDLEIARLNTEVSDAGQKVKDMQKVVDDAKVEVGQLQVARDTKDAELKAEVAKNVQLSAAVTGIQNGLDKKDQRIAELQKVNEDQRLEKDEAVRAREKAEDELKSCQTALENAQKMLGQTKQQLGEAQGTVTSMQEAAPALTFKSTKPEEPLINGVVVKVDNQSGLVMISVGKDDGVKSGYAFEIFRPNEYVGRVWVKEALDDRAMTQIDPQMTRGEIKEGDYVTTRLQ